MIQIPWQLKKGKGSNKSWMRHGKGKGRNRKQKLLVSVERRKSREAGMRKYMVSCER